MNNIMSRKRIKRDERDARLASPKPVEIPRIAERQTLPRISLTLNYLTTWTDTFRDVIYFMNFLYESILQETI